MDDMIAIEIVNTSDAARVIQEFGELHNHLGQMKTKFARDT
jgi:hypothetical protein